MILRKHIAVALAFVTVSFASVAQAQFAKPEDAIKYRKAALTVMATHFGRLSAMAQGKAPYDAKLAAENAELVASLSKLPWTAFVDGSDLGETKAKPEVWKQAAKFKEAADKLQQEVAKLAVAAKTGKEADLKPAVVAVGGACKACHDDFRSH